MNDNQKIENEKINLKINLKSENNEKIKIIKGKIKEILVKNEEILEKNKKINKKKKKLNKKIIIYFLGVLLLNIFNHCSACQK